MQLSRFTRCIEVDETTIGLYHSLLMEAIFLEKEELQHVRSYCESGVVKNKEIENTANHLLERNFLVVSQTDDEQLYTEALALLQPPAISNVYVVVTENCNFNCKYCFIAEAVNSGKQVKAMSVNVAKATVALLQRTYEEQKSDYDKVITFYGGEPLLNFDIIRQFVDEVERVKKTEYWPDDVRYAIITNGSLLTPEIVDYLKRHNFTLGISFDGSKLSHSNRLAKTGDETYDTVRTSIELCMAREMPFTLSITITEDLIANRDQVVCEILEIKPHDVAFNLLIPNKEAKPNPSYYERATDFMIEAFEVFREHGLYEDRLMRKVQAFIEGRLYPYDCCASGGNQFVISPEGNIGICHGYLNDKKYFSPSVFDENFNYRTNENFRHWRDRTPLLMEECANCECLGICGGGCPYAAELVNGTIYSLDERFCIHAKKILNWLVKDLFKNIKTD